jgi:hypothetical protein
MLLPPIQGMFQQDHFFIYVAADSLYFDRFGRSLINSVMRNTDFGVHVHLYNPTQSQTEFIQKNPRTSATWEITPHDQFDSAVKFWSQPTLSEPYASRRNKMLGLKQFSDSADLANWIRKTYYACMRFVRLAEFITVPRAFLEIDIDGIVRKPFVTRFDDGKDFHLYQKEKGGHLAGSILFNNSDKSVEFIQQLATAIKREILADNIYWFLDQNCLDRLIPGFNRGLLPISYVDWHMRPDSAIWSAKGKRKELEIFKKELGRYL